jgi:hypothetical protein
MKTESALLLEARRQLLNGRRRCISLTASLMVMSRLKPFLRISSDKPHWGNKKRNFPNPQLSASAGRLHIRFCVATYQSYHADTAVGIGECNALAGLAPLGFFLQTLGVTIQSPIKVRLEGRNPFPWPVTLYYRGLMVVRDKEYTKLALPNGKSITITDIAPCVVSI